MLDRAAVFARAICPDLYHLPLGWASLKIKTIIKSLPLLLAIPFSLLVFCFCPATVFAEMKSNFDLERGYFSPTSIPTPYDDAGVEPYPAEVDSKIFAYQVGSVVLGFEAKTYAPDSLSKSGDAKTNRVVIFGIGFHF